MHTGGSPAIFPAVGWFPSTEGGISRSRAQRSQDIDRGKNTHFRTPLRFKVPSLLQNSRGADWDWPLFPWCIPFASKVHPGFQGRSKSRSEVWSGGIFRAAVSWVARARIPRDFLRDLLRSERPEYSEDQSETLLEVLPLRIQPFSLSQHVTYTSWPGHCADLKKFPGSKPADWKDGGQGLQLLIAPRPTFLVKRSQVLALDGRRNCQEGQLWPPDLTFFTMHTRLIPRRPVWVRKRTARLL